MDLFVGIDVGGTNIQMGLVGQAGRVVDRYRLSTPPGASAEEVMAIVVKGVGDFLKDAGGDDGTLAGIGLAVPGVVDFPNNRIDAAPNIQISGIDLVTPMRETYGVPVCLANDVDAGTLGEVWFGPAGGTQNLVGVFVGTGIGGGVCLNGQLLRGERFSAGEVGHMIVERDGPMCNCGARGCVEAIASRTGIERQLFWAMKTGRPTILNELLKPEDTRIRSGVLAKALNAGDALVTDVMEDAARALGALCVTLRHLLDPGAIVFGGGVSDACGEMMLPIIRREVAKAPYFARHECRILLSALGDDAGVLGAAALAMQAVGLHPESIESQVATHMPAVELKNGDVLVDGKLFEEGELIVRAKGSVKPRDKNNREPVTSVSQITLNDLRRACKSGPRHLFIGADDAETASLSDACQTYLGDFGIDAAVLSRKKAVKAFTDSPGRKALLLLRRP